MNSNKNQAGWLSSTKEPALDADMPICDPHHHLWNHPTSQYLLDDLHEDTGSAHNITKTVFVECGSEYRSEGPESMRPVGETEFVAELARQSESMSGATIAGIVGFADLTLGEKVQEVLEAHISAGEGRFKGIRHASAWHEDASIHNAHTNPTADLFSRSSFLAGIRILRKLNLTFDAWLYHPQISDLSSLASANPNVFMLLDHLGGPLGIGPYKNKRDEVRNVWRPQIKELALNPNVFVKLGGIGMSIYGSGWHKLPQAPSSQDLADAWKEDVLFCIEHFGVKRCMFESNFPVDKRGCSYTVLWNAFQRMIEGASEDEKRSLFFETANDFYSLEI